MNRYIIWGSFATIVGVSVTFFAVRATHGQEEPDPTLRSLAERVKALEQQQPPIGAVIAFAKSWTPADELESGWALCDGRPLDDAKFCKLKSVLKTDNLPDYRGYFLRGHDPFMRIDKGDSEWDLKKKAWTVPTNRAFGSRQEDAISNTRKPFDPKNAIGWNGGLLHRFSEVEMRKLLVRQTAPTST